MEVLENQPEQAFFFERKAQQSSLVEEGKLQMSGQPEITIDGGIKLEWNEQTSVKGTRAGSMQSNIWTAATQTGKIKHLTCFAKLWGEKPDPTGLWDSVNPVSPSSLVLLELKVCKTQQTKKDNKSLTRCFGGKTNPNGKDNKPWIQCFTQQLKPSSAAEELSWFLLRFVKKPCSRKLFHITVTLWRSEQQNVCNVW